MDGRVERGKSSVLDGDLDVVAGADFIDWERLRESTVLVTGATGLVGGIAVRALARASSARGLGIAVVAACRSRVKAERLFAGLPGVEILEWDVMEPAPAVRAADYVIHAAAVTASATMVAKPATTILTTLKGTENALALAREKKSRAFAYVSSMEAYGVVAEGAGLLSESDYGYVDPLNPRSGYPESKRMAEGLCAAAAAEWGVNAKIARLVQTFGAGAPDGDRRVAAQFARTAARGEDIILHTDGAASRCYCYTADAVTGILSVMLRGEPGAVYNVADESSFASIRELAETLASLSGTGAKVRVEKPADLASMGYAPPSVLRVSAAKLRALGWRTQVPFRDALKRLLAAVREEG